MIWRKISPIFIIGILLLTACSNGLEQPTATQTPVPLTPTQTPTQEPQKTLTVCLGSEPTTLYPYGSSSRTTWAVLEAIYDGPFDVMQNTVNPVILEKTPSLTDGDATIETVDVTEGMQVVDATGDVSILKKGVTVYSPDCDGGNRCPIEWDGVSPLKMSQLTVTFKLLPGLTWSDGSPLTAADSVYSFNLSNDPDTTVTRGNLLRTARYEAEDELTVSWQGVPGFIPARFTTFFWLPLPQHAWSGLSAAELGEADISNRNPLGWGAYIISEWVAGDHITLKKNPLYFRAGEGLPAFDTLVYRFLGQPADNNIEALLSGECDLVDDTTLLDEQLELILELEQAGKLKAQVSLGPELELLSFGILPASYDDGYNPAQGDRPDFFTDVRVRQAFTQCMNRPAIQEAVLYSLGQVPATYLPPENPLAAPDVQPISYDPIAGALLLDEAGWKDLDGDPISPRKASGIPGIADGTPLIVNYATSNAPVRVTMAQILAESLSQCGIQVNVQYYEPADLYAPGPDGIAFGRKFDLLQWGYLPSCASYMSQYIPTAENNWIVVNIAGYSNPEYDLACQLALQTGTTELEEQQVAYAEVQRLLNQDVPFVPLYFRPHIAVSRTDLCGFKMESGTRSSLWSIEGYTISPECRN